MKRAILISILVSLIFNLTGCVVISCEKHHHGPAPASESSQGEQMLQQEEQELVDPVVE